VANPLALAVLVTSVLALGSCTVESEAIDMTGDDTVRIQATMDSAMKDESTCLTTIHALHDIVGEPTPAELGASPSLQATAAQVIGPMPADPAGAEAKRWRGLVLGSHAATRPAAAHDFCTRTAHDLGLYPGEIIR